MFSKHGVSRRKFGVFFEHLQVDRHHICVDFLLELPALSVDSRLLARLDGLAVVVRVEVVVEVVRVDFCVVVFVFFDVVGVFELVEYALLDVNFA